MEKKRQTFRELESLAVGRVWVECFQVLDPLLEADSS